MDEGKKPDDTGTDRTRHPESIREGVAEAWKCQVEWYETGHIGVHWVLKRDATITGFAAFHRIESPYKNGMVFVDVEQWMELRRYATMLHVSCFIIVEWEDECSWYLIRPNHGEGFELVYLPADAADGKPGPAVAIPSKNFTLFKK